jgi:XRE family aerobic/anaerobic benzoate catabolism transcriptional regulator
MHYTSQSDERRQKLLQGLGSAIRSRRTGQRVTLRVLAEEANVSERFLVQVELGRGNISVARLADVARAVGTTAAELLADAERFAGEAGPPLMTGFLVLLGLRGAGKSTLGSRAARALRTRFVELDQRIVERAGMSVGMIFDMHGEEYFQRLQREVLAELLQVETRGVIATGGSFVEDPDSLKLLRNARVRTVWLRARAEDHWDRVVAQGDARPMKDRTNAMAELRGLLKKRKGLYEKADFVIDTSAMSPDEATERLIEIGTKK